MPNETNPSSIAASKGNLSGGGWLLADMALNIWALTIVKALGLDYPPAQIVFIRAFVGLLIMIPFAWRRRGLFVRIDQLHLHALRVLFSTLALTTSYFAIARLPFALFTAISFTRPIVTMIMAVIFLKEIVAGHRWIAAIIAFIGVLIAVEPNTHPFSLGLPAMFLTVLFGTSAIILTRRLSAAPTIVMMVFYAGGLTLLTTPLAYLTWTAIKPSHLPLLLAIGVFSQCAQFCFLQAHLRAEAGFLAILGYLSLLLTTGVGYFVFDEVPSIPFFIGAILIVAAASWTTLSQRKTH